MHGDAFVEIPKLQGTFDFVFLDAWKPDYKKFFDMVYPRLDAGGVFLAHNVSTSRPRWSRSSRPSRTHPGLFTSIVSPGPKAFRSRTSSGNA